MASDNGPMARLQALKDDPNTPSVIFQRLTDKETLPDIAKSWNVPKGRLTEWFTVQHADVYDAAMKVVAADLAIEAMQAARDATPEDVSVKKLLADVALKLAAKFDRARYGETVRVEKSVTVGVDAGLLGKAGDLLRLAVAKRPLVIEQQKALAELPEEEI